MNVFYLNITDMSERFNVSKADERKLIEMMSNELSEMGYTVKLTTAKNTSYLYNDEYDYHLSLVNELKVMKKLGRA